MNASKSTNRLKDSALAELISAISLNEKSLPLALTRVALCELQERRKMEANNKPVAYTDEEELRFPHATSDMWPQPLGGGKDVPLYRQAQAMPEWVLPEIIPRSVFYMIYQQCGGFVNCEADPQAIWEACRDAMLKGDAA
ncbi:TPA: hypothetical protein I8167_000850 [Raoultella ornithinolytica]|nr:hypothetical protein [Raoultella ornithinolytica]ELM0226472.1 hypothetical protein [Raoultella ornithinolytica]ELS0711704.1 hypothetical protein [Raoultella ornithinolytica]ELS5420025.1 hypothetical protein [Raoultella ornithinolytica]HAT2176785.1 hypothetical protein [Raoultella ornithinolytica]